MRLTAAHAKGTAQIMRRSHVHLSPCVGLFAGTHALLANMHSIGLRGCQKQQAASTVGWESACALAVELFAPPRPGAPLRPTRSRSAALTHLSSAAAGHVLGLGLSGASAERVETTLRRCGISSNRVHGEWTGVSLARYVRLVDLLAADGVRRGAVEPRASRQPRRGDLGRRT
jgi:hypothetical protein